MNSFKYLFIVAILLAFEAKSQTAKLTFSELNIGLDSRFTSNQDSVVFPRYSNQAIGISGRFQTSVVANYVNKGKDKRFQIVDIVGGELAGGFFKSEDKSKKEPLWFAFRFDLGLGLLYNITKNQQIGLNWFVMRFANDFISDYISGSELQIRFRYKRFAFEAGTINRYVRFGGAYENYIKGNKNQDMYSFGFKYLLDNGKNIGFRLENYNPKAKGTMDQIMNIRAYYGLYF